MSIEKHAFNLSLCFMEPKSSIEMEIYTFVFTNQYTKGEMCTEIKAKDPKQNPEEPQIGVL